MAYTLVPTELIVDGAITSAKLDTNITISGTLGVTGELTLATHMIMGDNDKIKIGTGGDLEIYHDGSNSYISNSTGNIYLADTNGSVHIQAKLNEESIVCAADGAVTLYHDNASKLATSSTGIDVTGTVVADGLTVDGDATISDSTNPTLTITDTTTPTSLVFTAGNLSTTIGTTTDHRLKFDTNDIERLRIENNGDISFFNSAGTTEKLFWDSSAERLGIGTTSPAGSGLHIKKDTSATTNELLRLSNSAGSTTDGVKIVMEVANTSGNGGEIGVVRDGGSFNPYMFFSTSSGVGSSPTEAMRIDSSGNVLINRTGTSGLGKLNVEGGADFTGGNVLLCRDSGNVGIGTGASSLSRQLQLYKSSNSAYSSSSMETTNLQLYIRNADTTVNNHVGLQFAVGNNSDAAIAGVRTSDANAALTFGTRGTGSGNIIERMRIDSSGNVGIRTNAPDHDLHIESTNPTLMLAQSGSLNNSNSGRILFAESPSYTTNNSHFEIKYDGSANHLYFGSPIDGSTDLFVVGRNGNVGIGIVNQSGTRLYVDAPANTHASVFRNDTVNFAPIVVDNQATSGTRQLISFRLNNVEVGRITSTGSSTAYNTTSDYRLKENVDYDFNALDRVAQLKPARFNFIADADTTVDGFLAHEVEDIVPNAVAGEKDGEKMQSIDHSKLVPLLTKAIQEQQTIIDDLKSRIETLENE